MYTHTCSLFYGPGISRLKAPKMSSNGSDRVEAISGMKSGNSKKAILKSETYNARIARDNLTKEVASLRKTMGVQSNDDAEKLSLIKKINEMEKESENLLTPGDETIEELIVNISWLETELEGRKAESIHKETICLRAENKHRLQLQEVEKEMKKMEMEIKFYQNENFSLRRMMMETTLPEQQPALKELFKMTLKLDTLENNFYESRKSINTKLINYMEECKLLQELKDEMLTQKGFLHSIAKKKQTEDDTVNDMLGKMKI
eukprot:NP_492665.2 Uncharacterized protein CELE_Y106G6D.1 [Caenorhabditis elegans]